MNVCFLFKDVSDFEEAFNFFAQEFAPRPFTLRHAKHVTVDGVECGLDELVARMSASTREFCEVTINEPRLLHDHTIVAALTTQESAVWDRFHGYNATYVYVTRDDAPCDAFLRLAGSLAHSKCASFERIVVACSGESWSSEYWTADFWNAYEEAMTKHYDRRPGRLPLKWSDHTVCVREDAYLLAVKHALRPWPIQRPWILKVPSPRDIRRMMEPVRAFADVLRKTNPDDFAVLASRETAHRINLIEFAGLRGSNVFWDINVPAIFRRAGEQTLKSPDKIEEFLQTVADAVANKIVQTSQERKDKLERKKEEEREAAKRAF